MMKTESPTADAAIEYARQAPPISAQAATEVAAEVMLFRKALDVQDSTALQLIAALEGVGTQLNTYA